MDPADKHYGGIQFHRSGKSQGAGWKTGTGSGVKTRFRELATSPEESEIAFTGTGCFCRVKCGSAGRC